MKRHSLKQPLKIFNFIFINIFRLIGFSLTLLFLLMGWLGLTHEEPEDIDAFCEADCDKNSPDFYNCMDSCFQALGGAGLFQFVFLLFGILGAFITLFYILKVFEKFTKKVS